MRTILAAALLACSITACNKSESPTGPGPAPEKVPVIYRIYSAHGKVTVSYTGMGTQQSITAGIGNTYYTAYVDKRSTAWLICVGDSADHTANYFHTYILDKDSTTVAESDFPFLFMGNGKYGSSIHYTP